MDYYENDRRSFHFDGRPYLFKALRRVAKSNGRGDMKDGGRGRKATGPFQKTTYLGKLVLFQFTALHSRLRKKTYAAEGGNC